MILVKGWDAPQSSSFHLISQRRHREIGSLDVVPVGKQHSTQFRETYGLKQGQLLVHRRIASFHLATKFI